MHDHIVEVQTNVSTESSRSIRARKRAVDTAQDTTVNVVDLQQEKVYMDRLVTIGQIATVVASEANEPLSAAYNYLNACGKLLGQPNLESDRLQRLIQHAIAETERAAATVRRLHHFAMAKEPQKQSVHVNHLMLSAMAMVDAAARQHGVTVSIDADRSGPRVMADEMQLQQALVNLANLALTTIGTASIDERSLEFATSAETEGYVVIRFQGKGLAQFDQMFDSEEQTDVNQNASTRFAWSVAQHMVKANGGSISFVSNRGETAEAVIRVIFPIAHSA